MKRNPYANWKYPEHPKQVSGNFKKLDSHMKQAKRTCDKYAIAK